MRRSQVAGEPARAAAIPRKAKPDVRLGYTGVSADHDGVSTSAARQGWSTLASQWSLIIPMISG
jgi:hypothetical protein